MINEAWISQLLKLTSSQERLRILAYLAEQDREVISADISEATGIKATTLGRMLRELEDAGFIHADLPPNRRKGRTLRYTLNRAAITDVLKTSAQHLGAKL